MATGNVWVLKPYHAFFIEEAHYVYDVLRVAAYIVSLETYAFLKDYEAADLQYNAEVRIPEAAIPKELRGALRGELEDMKLLGGLPADETDAKVKQYLEQSRVNELVFALSSKCNLDCVYCYEVQNGFRNASRCMTLEMAKASIDHFFAQGKTEKLYVNFMGGETLLKFDRLQEIVAYACQQAEEKALDIGFKITTNATLLGDEKVAFLKKHNFRVLVSLDGSAEVQDKNRPLHSGKGSYLQAARGARKLLHSLPDTQVHVTVTSAGTNLKKILGHHEELGFKSENVNFDFAVADSGADYTVLEFGELKEQYMRVAKGREPDVPGGKLGKHATFMRTVLTQRRDSLVYCGAALSVLAVGPDGALYPCAGFFGVKKYQLGTAATWINEEQRLRYVDRTLVHKKTECKGCWARMACSGGCAMNALLKTGDVAAPGQQNCEFFRFQLEVAVDSLASEPLLPETQSFEAAPQGTAR